MADYQVDWIALLSSAEADQQAFATLMASVDDALKTAQGTVGAGGEGQRIADHMVSSVSRGAPGAHVVQQVAGLASEAKRSLTRAAANIQIARDALRASNVALLSAAAEIKTAKGKVGNV